LIRCIDFEGKTKMAKDRTNYQPTPARLKEQPLPEEYERAGPAALEDVHQSAMGRAPVTTRGGTISWRRILFAAIGSAFLTVLIVYVVFHLFGIAAGATTGDVAGGVGPFAAVQQLSGWTTLILAVIFTFLGALWCVRSTAEKSLLQGLIVGMLAAILIVGPLIGFLGGELDGFSILTFVMTVASGALAGLMGR
jgi:putative membrane protein (TIGR04086 family)